MNTTPTTTHERTPVATAAALYDAFAAQDLERFTGLLAPDAVIHVPGAHPLAGDHVGRDAVIGFVIDTSVRADRTESIEVLDLLGGDTHAAAYCHVTGVRDGRVDLDNTTVHVLRVADGLVREIWFHNWDQARVDEFWS